MKVVRRSFQTITGMIVQERWDVQPMQIEIEK
jgi:hypothetical protein